MAEPTPSSSPLFNLAKKFIVGLPADIVTVGGALWYILSNKQPEPRGNIRDAILLIPTTQRPAALQWVAHTLGEQGEKLMNARYTTQSSAEILRLPRDQWSAYIPRGGQIPKPPREQIADSARRTRDAVQNWYDHLEPETKAGFQRYGDWAEAKQKRRREIADKRSKIKRGPMWIIGGLLAAWVMFMMVRYLTMH